MDLNQITISVSDLNKSIEFYEMIGMRLIVNTHDKYARFECPDGNTTFSLSVTGDHIGSQAMKLYFETEDVDLKFDELCESGVVFESAPVDKTFLWREAWFLDPDGHMLCIYWAGENRKFPPWRIN